MAKITVAEAAKRIGMSQQFVRIGMQRDRLPIGVAVKMSSKWTYNIQEHLLNEYVGVEVKHESDKN